MNNSAAQVILEISGPHLSLLKGEKMARDHAAGQLAQELRSMTPEELGIE